MIIGNPWTAAEKTALAQLCSHLTDAEIGKVLGRSKAAVAVKRLKMGLPTRLCVGGVSSKRYASLVVEACAAARVPADVVLSDSKTRAACVIRWQVWRALRTGGASIPAIARAAGYDPTTVGHGLRRAA